MAFDVEKTPISAFPPAMQYLFGLCARRGELRVPVDLSQMTDPLWMALNGIRFTKKGLRERRRRNVSVESPPAVHMPHCAAYEAVQISGQ